MSISARSSVIAFRDSHSSCFITFRLSNHRQAGSAKHVFQILDQQAIYLVNAGTYTPFTIVVFKDAEGWRMFGAIWSLAIFGIILDAIPANKTRIIPMFHLPYYGMALSLRLEFADCIASIRWLSMATYRWNFLYFGHRFFILDGGTRGATGFGAFLYSQAAFATTSRFLSSFKKTLRSFMKSTSDTLD